MHKQINQLRADLMAQFPERKDVIDGSLAALRFSRNTSGAAARLGMAPVSLSRWVGRRRLPPKIPRDRIEPCSPSESTTAIATLGSYGSRR
jgi:hypothetical protein